MSHITAVKTAIVDFDALETAMAEMGLALERGENLTVRDYYGTEVPVVARISITDRYALGLRRSGDAYELAGDFWGVAQYTTNPAFRTACREARGSVEQITRAAEAGIGALVARRYGVAAVKREVARNPKYRGFSMEEVRENGEVVRIALRKRGY
jgi:hypothetical protein